jgi:hypothetical protein
MELTNTEITLIGVLLLMAVWGCAAVAMDYWAGRSDSPPSSLSDSGLISMCQTSAAD